MPSVSDEQIQKAKSVDILAYLHTHEPDNIRRSGAGRYCLKDHDSVIISNNRWHRFSQNIGGYNALDFLIKVRGMGFIDAVRHLTDGGTAYRSPPPEPEQKRTAKPFILPPKNINNDRVYAYLRGRGIDSDIIKRCFNDGILYENTQGDCVFVGYSGNTPKFACERGTKDRFMKDVAGSNKAYSFVLTPKNTDRSNLACFESPIDSLSHASIHKMGNDEWDGYRLSLGGVGSIALTSFLDRNPQIKHIRLSLDCDKTGRDATNRIFQELLSNKRYSHLRISDAPPPIGKDYSDTLQAIIQLHKQKTHTDRSKEAVNYI